MKILISTRLPTSENTSPILQELWKGLWSMTTDTGGKIVLRGDSMEGVTKGEGSTSRGGIMMREEGTIKEIEEQMNQAGKIMRGHLTMKAEIVLQEEISRPESQMSSTGRIAENTNHQKAEIHTDIQEKLKNTKPTIQEEIATTTTKGSPTRGEDLKRASTSRVSEIIPQAKETKQLIQGRSRLEHD